MENKFAFAPTDGYKLFRDIQKELLPSVGALINQLIIAGKGDDEIRAAVKSAARAYQVLAMEFIDPEQTISA